MILYITVDCDNKTFTVDDNSDEWWAEYSITDITIDEIIQQYQEENS